MEFPVNSLGAFIAGFGITSLFLGWLRTYVLGWYETKWSPGFNLSIDAIATLFLLLPLAAFGFALGAYLVNTPHDPWGRSLVGGLLLSLLFFGATRVAPHIDSDALSGALIWGTLVLGSASVGAMARYSARVAA
jgi:hypothetical protein